MMSKVHCLICLLLAAAVSCAAGSAAQQKRPANNEAVPQPVQFCVNVPQQQCGCGCGCGSAAPAGSPGAMPAGQAMPTQEIKLTITHNSRAAQPVKNEQQPPIKLPSSWPPQTPEEVAAAAATLAALAADQSPPWWDSRVVIGTAVLVAALLLYFIASRINRQYKRQWLRKLRQVPGLSAVSDGSTPSDLVSLIDRHTSSPLFQCFFIAGAASVGFIWPHWDWMVLLVVILQHVLLRLLGFAVAAVFVSGHAAAHILWQFVANASGIWLLCLRGVRWLSSWVKHGDVAVLVTADSLDCSACSELDDGLRLHSSDSTGSSCSAGSSTSSGSSRSKQQQQRGRKQKAHRGSSSNAAAQQHGSKQGSVPASEPAATAAVNSHAAASSPMPGSAASQPATTTQPDHKQRSAKAAAAAAAASPSKAAVSQAASPMLQPPAYPKSPIAADAKRRVSIPGSTSSRDQLTGASDTKRSSNGGGSSTGKSKRDKAAKGASGGWLAIALRQDSARMVSGC